MPRAVGFGLISVFERLQLHAPRRHRREPEARNGHAAT